MCANSGPELIDVAFLEDGPLGLHPTVCDLVSRAICLEMRLQVFNLVTELVNANLAMAGCLPQSHPFITECIVQIETVYLDQGVLEGVQLADELTKG